MSSRGPKVLASIGAVAVLVAGGYAFRDTICPALAAAVNQCQLNKTPQKQAVAQTPPPLAQIEELAPRYYVYSPAALERAHEISERVILYFWAPWCTSCSSLDVEIEKNPEIIPSDAVVLRIPYDSSTELKRKYSVTTQHTFVLIDAENEPVKFVVGGDPAAVLE